MIKFYIKKICNRFLSIVSFFYIFILTLPALAAESEFNKGLKTTGEIGAGYPAAAATNPAAFMSKMLGSALTPMFMGVTAMFSLCYGGYKWMMARGNEQEVELAKTIIINTLIATVVAFAALAIVKLIIPVWTFVAK